MPVGTTKFANVDNFIAPDGRGSDVVRHVEMA